MAAGVGAAWELDCPGLSCLLGSPGNGLLFLHLQSGNNGFYFQNYWELF